MALSPFSFHLGVVMLEKKKKERRAFRSSPKGSYDEHRIGAGTGPEPKFRIK